MGLAMNRYIGNSILPLLIGHSQFYNEADNYASLLDATLHTVYRLSKNRMLTKGQREAVSDFLVALTRCSVYMCLYSRNIYISTTIYLFIIF
jgi:ryanodine receptor 2